MPMCHYCSLCQLGSVVCVWTLTPHSGEGTTTCLLFTLSVVARKDCVHLDLSYDGGRTGDILLCLLHL